MNDGALILKGKNWNDFRFFVQEDGDAWGVCDYRDARETPSRDFLFSPVSTHRTPQVYIWEPFIGDMDLQTALETAITLNQNA